MGFILKIVGFVLLLDVLCLAVLVRLANQRVSRIVISVFIILMMLGLVGGITARVFRSDWGQLIPKFVVTAIFIWHSIGLGVFALIGLLLIRILLGQNQQACDSERFLKALRYSGFRTTFQAVH